MTPTSSRQARRMVIEEIASMRVPTISLARRRQAKRLLGLTDPAPDGGVAVEVKAALMRQSRIGQQRDVGEREGIADQKSRRGQLVLHPCQRGIATLDLVGIEI